MVRLLIDQQLDWNEFDMDDNTPLHYAVSSDDDKEEVVQDRITCIKHLLSGKADVNASNIRRETPLHNASRYGSRELVDFLLDHNADLLMTNVKGLNCLEMAIAEKNENVVKYFIEHDRIFELMRNAQIQRVSISNIITDNRVDTPMRKLIVDMPKMALLMLDKCTIEIGAENTGLHMNIYNYEFLDDEYFVNSWTKGKKKMMTFQSKLKVPITVCIVVKI